MPQWEYLDAYIAWDADAKTWVWEIDDVRYQGLTTILNTLGDIEWELVNVVPEGSNGSLSLTGIVDPEEGDSDFDGPSDNAVVAYRAFFKRPRTAGLPYLPE